jgi:hypothetical protein
MPGLDAVSTVGHSLHVSAGNHVNRRKPIANEFIAGVHDAILREEVVLWKSTGWALGHHGGACDAENFGSVEGASGV